MKSANNDVVVEKRGGECMDQPKNHNSDKIDKHVDDDDDDDNETPSCFNLSNVCAEFFRNHHEDTSATT